RQRSGWWQRLHRDRSRSARELRIGRRARALDQHQQGRGARPGEVAEHFLTSLGRLLEVLEAAQHHNTPRGEHGWRVDQAMERAGVEIGCAASVEVEVARGGVYDELDE